MALRGLADGLAARGLKQRVVGFTDREQVGGEWASYHPKTVPRSSPLGDLLFAGNDLEGVIEEAGILHTHGLWTRLSVQVPKIACRRDMPWLVSPHGMLDQWALAHSAWKKKIAAVLFERNHLSGAACLHALCRPEAQSIRSYGLKNPVCVIPNGVELVNAENLKTGKLKPEKKTLLFLGRIHPKKGLLNALRALSETLKTESGKLNIDDWQFVIAGWNQGGHEAELKELATELGIRWADVRQSGEESSAFNVQFREFQLLFVGPAFGVNKERLLRSASAFILPSFSEGLPMSVLEAWSYGLPVLMTDHCNLPEGFAANAALRIGTDVENIATGLSGLLHASASDLQALGDNGRALVERQFTWDQVAAQMKQVYDWILGGGGAPDCVFLNAER
ncbi:glycosyltransferase [Akkermansiaceae bacterium]|nr:glycosyltransferase [Akkermansiaceae bacterium]